MLDILLFLTYAGPDGPMRIWNYELEHVAVRGIYFSSSADFRIPFKDSHPA